MAIFVVVCAFLAGYFSVVELGRVCFGGLVREVSGPGGVAWFVFLP